MNRLAVIITSELNNINKVEDFIERTIKEFKLSENLRGKITLAVIEAVNNSILYGNKQNPQKLVKLTAFKGHQRVIFTVEDGGEENEQVHKAGYYPNRGGRGCGVRQAPVYRYVRDTQECGNHVQPA